MGACDGGTLCNITKTCDMVFKAKFDDNVIFFCGQRVIKKVDNCHYLGVVELDAAY